MVQQTGFARQKRGYQPLRQRRGYSPLRVENLAQLAPHKDPTDPFFKYQWYLVGTEY